MACMPNDGRTCTWNLLQSWTVRRWTGNFSFGNLFTRNKWIAYLDFVHGIDKRAKELLLRVADVSVTSRRIGEALLLRKFDKKLNNSIEINDRSNDQPWQFIQSNKMLRGDSGIENKTIAISLTYIKISPSIANWPQTILRTIRFDWICWNVNNKTLVGTKIIVFRVIAMKWNILSYMFHVPCSCRKFSSAGIYI